MAPCCYLCSLLESETQTNEETCNMFPPLCVDGCNNSGSCHLMATCHREEGEDF